MWLGLANVASIEMEAPKRLRDLLWAPALVRTGPAFKGTELGEVLMPAICPLSFRQQDDAVTFPVEGVDGGSISMLTVQVAQR